MLLCLFFWSLGNEGCSARRLYYSPRMDDVARADKNTKAKLETHNVSLSSDTSSFERGNNTYRSYYPWYSSLGCGVVGDLFRGFMKTSKIIYQLLEALKIYSLVIRKHPNTFSETELKSAFRYYERVKHGTSN